MQIIDVNTLFGAYPSRHPDSTPASLMAAMVANGVSRSLTISTSGIFHSDVAGNQQTMAACKVGEGLVPVATIDPRGFWGQPNALQAVSAGFAMYRFFPEEQRWPVDFAPFREIVDALASSAPKPMMVGMRNPGDITRIAVATAAYPQPIILDGVSSETLSEAISVMRKNDRIYLETHALRSPESLQLLRDTVGIARVLFGSEAPGLSLGAQLRYVRGSGLSDADQAAVLGGNAMKIWSGGA